MKQVTKQEYQKKVNMVIDYISNHLDENLDLAKLSAISAISPFHFHRIVKAYLGEPIGSYTIRLRVETGSHLLRYSSVQVDEIATKMGYDSPTSFSKAFKKHFGISPTEFRNSKDMSTRENIIVEHELPKGFSLKPKIIDRKSKKALYIRLIGSYLKNDYNQAWEKICGFAKEKHLFEFNQEFLGVANSDPNVTDGDKCQYDCCITISKDIKPEGEFGMREINGGKYAVFIFKGSYSYFSAVYDAIFKNWLPESGIELRNSQSFEKYIKTSKTNPEKNKTEIYIPII